MNKLPKREFNLGDKGFFFLSNSFNIHNGEVIGFFLNPTDNGEKFYYQLRYEISLIDGTKAERWATVPAEEIFLEREEAKKIFVPLKKTRMEDALENIHLNLETNKVAKVQATENIDEINKEQTRLLAEYEKDYGKYLKKEVKKDKEKEKV